MSINIQTLIVWLVVGLLAGTAAGAVLSRRRKGFGTLVNLVVGLVGALIGGLLFNLLGIDIAPGIVITLNDLVAAFIGAVLFVVILRLVRR